MSVVDKYVWQLPIPLFSVDNPLHLDLVTLASKAANEAATVTLRPGDFRLQRKQIRDHLAKVGLAASIDEGVARLLER